MESLANSAKVFKSPGINVAIFSYFGNYLEFYYFITQANKEIGEAFFKWEEEYKNMLNDRRIEIKFYKFNEKNAKRILQLSEHFEFFKFRIFAQTPQDLTELFNITDIWDNIEQLRILHLTWNSGFDLIKMGDLEIYSKYIDFIDKYPNVIEEWKMNDYFLIKYYLKEDQDRVKNIFKYEKVCLSVLPELFETDYELKEAETDL